MRPTIIVILKDFRIVETFRRKLGERYNFVFYHSPIAFYPLIFFTNPDLILIDAHAFFDIGGLNRFLSLLNLTDSVIVLGTGSQSGYRFWRLPINLLEIPRRLDDLHITPNRGALLRYVYNAKTPHRVFDVEQGYYMDTRAGEIIKDSRDGFLISALMRWIVRNTFVSHSAIEYATNFSLDVPVVGKTTGKGWLKRFDIAGRIISTGLNKDNIFISRIHFTRGGNFVYHTTFSFDVVLEFIDGTKLVWEEVLSHAA